MTTDAQAAAQPGGRNLPKADGGLPVIGHAIPFFQDPVGFLLRAHGRQGEAVTFSLPGRRVASFCGPQANAVVLSLDDTEADRRPVYEPLLAPLLGRGVGFNAPADVMTWHHSLLLPHLRRDALTRHAAIMFDQMERYVAPWNGDGTFDLMAVMRDITARISAHCLIGPRFGRTLAPVLPALLSRLEASFFMSFAIGPRPFLPHHRRADRARETLTRAIKEIAPRDRPEGKKRSHFEELMRAEGPDGRSLDEETAAALMLSWLFAAVPITIHAAWTGVLLLQHPQWLPVLRAEQESAFTDYPPTTLSPLHKLERLGHCLLEAERLHPAIWLLPRLAVRDLCIRGYRVPRGYLVCASPGASHRLPDVFRDPGAFDPDRYLPDQYLPDRTEHGTAHHALIGFGGGRHPCLGPAFAQQAIKVIWSVLLRAFDLELAGPDVREVRASVFHPPRQPCTVRYRRRKR
ncbi:cytochrome P450 [Streptomyces rectiverticillatus]|uniref:cytochrome P450 n=1 Tax=Streptomyces rectiverticillatus TaxID=173860 RepID=UPI0015C30CCD|nr:cytochrome P450 [Streptomyces rectiverticillatus]QLE70260.1 cytochrome P450 [Streptomyces rectiverticillatus]